MRRIATMAAILLIAVVARGHERFTTAGCLDRNFQFDGERAYVAEQFIEAGNLQKLKAVVSNSPVSVRGGNGAGYTITACKAAARIEDLDAIRVSVDGGELKTIGPEGRDWAVTYQIRTPRGANLEIETRNGPVSLTDVDGRVVARAANGPLSLKNVSGDVDASTTNGPISVTGGSGTMKVQASNGPLSINLDGAHWRGGTLEASTQNGPLNVRIPEGYASGVVVESRGRGPLTCRVAGCEQFEAARRGGRDRWGDEPRRIELGTGPEAVRLATVNGPVTIRER